MEVQNSKINYSKSKKWKNRTYRDHQKVVNLVKTKKEKSE